MKEARIPIRNISVSAPIYEMDAFDKSLHAVLNSSKIGNKISHLDPSIFFYEDLGIYKFLIDLKEKNKVLICLSR